MKGKCSRGKYLFGGIRAGSCERAETALYTVKVQDGNSTEEALGTAIAAIGSADFVPAVLDYYRTLAPFRGCLLVALEGAKRPVHLYDNVRAEKRASVIDQYLNGAYLLDPFYTAYLYAPTCDVLRLRDVAPDRFQKSTYFLEYYRAIRLQDELAIFVDVPDGRHLFYSIGRLRDETKFAARDVAALRKALPVFAALNRRHFGGRRRVEEDYAVDGVVSEVNAAFERFGTHTLTEREREIAGLILKGHSSKSIARTIDISPGTVKIHRKNIYRKLEISSQSELFARFLSALTMHTES